MIARPTNHSERINCVCGTPVQRIGEKTQKNLLKVFVVGHTLYCDAVVWTRTTEAGKMPQMRNRLSEGDDENCTVRHVDVGRSNKSDQAWSSFVFLPQPLPMPCSLKTPSPSSPSSPSFSYSPAPRL